MLFKDLEPGKKFVVVNSCYQLNPKNKSEVLMIFTKLQTSAVELSIVSKLLKFPDITDCRLVLSDINPYTATAENGNLVSIPDLAEVIQVI
jgi:hypothetical protein